MKNSLLTWQKKIIKKLNKLLEQAIEQENLTVALQCIKVLASIHSLAKDSEKSHAPNLSLSSLSKTDLENLIQEGSKKFQQE